MQSGEIVAGRFELGAVVAGGGMGTIWRATDMATSQPVALKVLQGHLSAEAGRFQLEARTLSALSHPAIVKYIAHGTAGQGEAFLAMEWLDGEDLAARLHRVPLAAADAIAVVRRAAEGLAAAHAAGVVHRDIKPSNIFLVGGAPERAKVLDFGIARMSHGNALTRTGAILGTVGYMAPEQASGARDVDLRADLFSLGAVLFECLAGRPLFFADHPIAVLAKVLREEAPRLRDFRPDLPPALDAMLASMLAKSPEERPVDAASIVQTLDTLGDFDVSSQPTLVAHSTRVTGGEQRLMTVMLLSHGNPSELAETWSPERAAELQAAAREIVQRFGAEAVVMANGSILCSDARPGGARDLATRMATCALALAEAIPETRISLAIGNVDPSRGLAMGPVIESAVRLLPAEAGIFVDTMLASLLDMSFELVAGERSAQLVGRVSDNEFIRPLLGKASPCVGREKELALLDATLEEVIEEEVSRVVLVTAPAGTGKTRLCSEILQRARRKGAAVLLARGDAMASGGSFLLARQLVRQAAAVREGEPVDDQARKLQEHLDSIGTHDRSVREFLGELLGIPAPGEPSPALRAARNEPRILRDAIVRAFVDWLSTLLRERALVVAIDDLHWGDLASVTLLEEALAHASDRPCFVLALARPEAHEVFPRLWHALHPQEIRLSNLTRKASERLVRAALGDSLPAALVARVIEQADGNAFFLEELIRSAATGGLEQLPPTVIAMVQARIGQLDARARIVLRAASIFGEVFWAAGVSSILTATMDITEVDGWLKTLTEGELLSRRTAARFPGQQEFAFRHALVREAAYAMVTETDRRAGHLAAGEWLMAAGEGSPMVLAEHFAKGADLTRAGEALVRAAHEAMTSGQLDLAISIVERGLAWEVTRDTRGKLLVVKGAALGRVGRIAELLAVAQEAFSYVSRGTPDWFFMAGGSFCCAMMAGDTAFALSLLPAWFEGGKKTAPLGNVGWATYLAAVGCLLYGQLEAARTLMAKLDDIDPEYTSEPVFEGWRSTAWCYFTMCGDISLGAARAHGEAAMRSFVEGGDPVGWAGAASQIGALHAEVGDQASAKKLLRDAIDQTRATKEYWLESWLVTFQCRASLLELDMQAVEEHFDDPSAQIFAATRLGLLALTARAALATGRLSDAENRLDLARMKAILPAQTAAARIFVARGREADALKHLARGRSLCQRGGQWPSDVSDFLHTRAELLHTMGQLDAARIAAKDAWEYVNGLATTLIALPDWQDSYLNNVPINQRVLQLAAELGVGGSGTRRG